jgi:hypothetical protein
MLVTPVLLVSSDIPRLHGILHIPEDMGAQGGQVSPSLGLRDCQRTKHQGYGATAVPFRGHL